MNNRQPDYALPEGTLRNLVNIDVDSAGHLHRRDGYTRIVSGTNCRGGFSCPIGTFFIQGADLHRLNDDDTTTVLFSGVHGTTPTYECFNDVVYFSDGLITKKITAAGVTDWGLPVPATPTVYATSGPMPTGDYLVAITFVDADGIESGASDLSVASILPGSTGSIVVTGMAVGRKKRVYASTPNGATLFLITELPASTSTYTITTAELGTGAPLATQQVCAPPPGQIIREHNGRLYIASDRLLWVTEPYAPDWVNLSTGFIMQADYITVVEPVDAGVWVVSDKTYFFQGSGPEDFTIGGRLDYGAVYGTSARVPYTRDVVWYTPKGLVLATGDGQVKNLQDQDVAPHTGTSGAALVREQDGLRQAVVSVQNAEVSRLAADSFIQMEVIRKSGGLKP
jgi:hypothetical protein